MASYGKSFRWSSQPYNFGAIATFADWHSYSDSCNKVKSGWKRVWENEQAVPYAVSGNVMLGYDDVESITIKVITMNLYS